MNNKSRRHFQLLIALITGLLVVIIFSALSMEIIPVNAEQLLPTDTSTLTCLNSRNREQITKIKEINLQTKIEGWTTYHDNEYNFYVDIPLGWVYSIDLKLENNNSNSIERGDTILGKEAIIYLDIWSDHGMDLRSWIQSQPLFKSKEIRYDGQVLVDGKPSVIYIEKGADVDVVSILFIHDKYIFNTRYQVTNQASGMEGFLGIINSFRSTVETTKGFIFTENINSEIYSLVPRSTINPLSNTCCNLTATGNPFPCCGSNQGNCTWYVWYYFKTYFGTNLRFTGDAGTWWGQAPAFGYHQLTEPYVYSISWKGGSPGHVGVVTNIYDTTIRNYQMSCFRPADCMYIDFPSISSYKYIYPFPGPLPYSHGK